jgi:hypothetical protein
MGIRASLLSTGFPARLMPGRSSLFSAKAKKRLLLVSLPDPICQSQIFPFQFYKGTLYARWGYEVREIGLETLLKDPDQAPKGADLVCFQCWIDKTHEELQAIVALLRSQHPGAKLAFLDPCAPTDVRFASSIGSMVDFYIKKHVLRDRSAYLRPTIGDTNLTDWYGPRYGEDLPEVHFALPTGFLDKLLVGPSFLTAGYMLPRFSAVAGAPQHRRRKFDLHARLGGSASKGWYGRMRTDALDAVRRLDNVKVTPDSYVNKRQYMRELENSKLCFSPFGYGEVCWRDYEAVFSGALLLKPDMAHVETSPNIFVSGDTYVSMKWDFSDLGDVVAQYLENESARSRISANAYEALWIYAKSERFVDQLDRIFAAS